MIHANQNFNWGVWATVANGKPCRYPWPCRSTFCERLPEGILSITITLSIITWSASSTGDKDTDTSSAWKSDVPLIVLIFCLTDLPCRPSPLDRRFVIKFPVEPVSSNAKELCALLTRVTCVNCGICCVGCSIFKTIYHICRLSTVPLCCFWWWERGNVYELWVFQTTSLNCTHRCPWAFTSNVTTA